MLLSTTHATMQVTAVLAPRKLPRMWPASTAQATAQVTAQAESVEEQVLAFCQQAKSRAEIQEHLGLKDREHFRKEILNPLLDSGQLLRTLPDKPTSPKQKFYTAQVNSTNSDAEGRGNE